MSVAHASRFADHFRKDLLVVLEPGKWLNVFPSVRLQNPSSFLLTSPYLANCFRGSGVGLFYTVFRELSNFFVLSTKCTANGYLKCELSLLTYSRPHRHFGVLGGVNYPSQSRWTWCKEHVLAIRAQIPLPPWKKDFWHHCCEEVSPAGQSLPWRIVRRSNTRPSELLFGQP